MHGDIAINTTRGLKSMATQIGFLLSSYVLLRVVKDPSMDMDGVVCTISGGISMEIL